MYTQKQAQYVSDVRKSTKKLVETLNELAVHQAVFNAEVYGDTLPDGDVTKDEIGAVVFDTYNAIQTTLDADGGGKKGNIYKII